MIRLPLAVDTFVAVSQLVPIALVGLLYAVRARSLAAERRPVRAWRQASFYAGLLTIAATVLALDHHARASLSWYTVQLFLIGEVAALLLVLGLTAGLLAPILRITLFERLRVLANPLLAFPLWAANLWVWHLPVLYESALHSGPTQALQHLCFLAFGINMWMCLFGPLPTPRWFGDVAKLGYIVVVRLTGFGLANLFLWSDTVFYPYFIHRDLVHQISPLVDQNVAGAVMLIGGTVLTIGLFGWLFVHAARERAELGDLAHEGGSALEDQRAHVALISGGRAGRPGRFQRGREPVVVPPPPPS